MQISRHWRLNAQRYRLQGVRYENGETSLQARPLLGRKEGGPVNLEADDNDLDDDTARTVAQAMAGAE